MIQRGIFIIAVPKIPTFIILLLSRFYSESPRCLIFKHDDRETALKFLEYLLKTTNVKEELAEIGNELEKFD
jgi:hypothetical protein